MMGGVTQPRVKGRFGAVDPLVRFRAKIKLEGGCAIWVGLRSKGGYGRFSVSGREVYVHRWAYESFVGQVPDGKELDHVCRNHACAGVTPGGVVLGHLEPVTHRENNLRGVLNNGRSQRTHCPQGHAYDAANTYINPRGERQCRECARDAVRRYRATKR